MLKISLPQELMLKQFILMYLPFSMNRVQKENYVRNMKNCDSQL